MNWNDFATLDINRLEEAPLGVQRTLLGLLLVVLLLLGHQYILKQDMEALGVLQDKVHNLEENLAHNQEMAAHLKTNEARLVAIQEQFRYLLLQLPNKTGMDDLLRDVNAAGEKAGLTFLTFEPMPEKRQTFYAEKPILIAMRGHYHQLGDFVQKVASLSRLVTLEGVVVAQVAPEDRGEKPGPVLQKNGKAFADKNKDDIGMLDIGLLAKTFRYLDPGETSGQGEPAVAKP